MLGPWLGGRTFNTPGHADGIGALLFTGGYPALTWVPFVIAGMAVARLDLAATATRVRLALTGVALAVIGYGGSWLALRLVPGAADAVELLKGGSSMASSSMSSGPPSPSPGSGMYGDSLFGLLVAYPHSETTLSVVGNTGVAVRVVSACLAAAASLPRLRRLASPVMAVGSMSLTAYVLHIVAIWLLETGAMLTLNACVLPGFIVSITVFAVIWSRFFRRAPLEWVMGRATGIARRIR